MMFQRALIRLSPGGRLGRYWHKFLLRRIWTIEGGEGSGLKITYPQNTDYITGMSELPVQRAISQRLQPGDIFYDIGANVGFFSLIAGKKVGPGGRVYSFEPVAKNCASIIDNAKINRFEQVIAFEVAAGKSSGREELLLTAWDGGASLASSIVRPHDPIFRSSVRVVALDDFIQQQNLRKPVFVKIDVEGSEFDVLQGMAKTIERSKPVLLYEIDDGNRDAFDLRWKELDQYVAGFGYEIQHLDNAYPTLNWNVGHSLAIPVQVKQQE